jgi:hypothetical protein
MDSLRRGKITETAVLAELSGAPTTAEQFPPVKQRWLTPAVTVAVVLAHIGAAVLLMTTVIEWSPPLDNSLSVDLVPEGDTIHSGRWRAVLHVRENTA